MMKLLVHLFFRRTNGIEEGEPGISPLVPLLHSPRLDHRLLIYTDQVHVILKTIVNSCTLKFILCMFTCPKECTQDVATMQ